MEDIINEKIFIEYLTYYIKIGIYINKGTYDDYTLDRCISLYNKFKKIEASAEKTDNDNAFVRRCYKRLNLVLKTEPDLTPVDIQDKNNQPRIYFLPVHSSIINNSVNDMIEYASTNDINILTDIPLNFILRESKYQELLWQYTRALFYISDFIVSNIKVNGTTNDRKILARLKNMDDAIKNLEVILDDISKTQEQIKINEVLALDKFINTKLIKTGINEIDINTAKNKIKEKFKTKGLGDNKTLNTMVDSITDTLRDIDMSQGNVVERIFGISHDIAKTMKPELEKNPENMQPTIQTILEVFQEIMETTDEEEEGDDALPSELKDLFGSLVSMAPKMNGSGGEMDEENIAKTLDLLATSKGIDKDAFYKEITSQNGNIDLGKLESMLTLPQ